MLEDKELTMNHPEHREMVKFHIQKHIEKINYIQIGEKYNSPEERIDKIMEDFSENCPEKMNGNTLLLYSDDKIMYEVLFLENSINQIDENLNDFGSITNIELYPIYGDCAIIKTSIDKDILINEIIYKNDIFDIFYNNFYHTGVMINSNIDMKELIFSGDKPATIIGNTFNNHFIQEVFGLQFVIYEEKCDEFKNELVSKLCGKNIFGRTFVCLLSPVFFKKFFNNKISILNIITSLLSDNEKSKQIDKDLADDKISNPFVILSKYK